MKNVERVLSAVPKPASAGALRSHFLDNDSKGLKKNTRPVSASDVYRKKIENRG